MGGRTSGAGSARRTADGHVDHVENVRNDAVQLLDLNGKGGGGGMVSVCLDADEEGNRVCAQHGDQKATLQEASEKKKRGEVKRKGVTCVCVCVQSCVGWPTSRTAASRRMATTCGMHAVSSTAVARTSWRMA